jgi:hypothetical protein
MRLDRFEEASLTAKLRAPIREDELARGSKLSAIGLEVARKIFAMDENERSEYLDAYRILQHLLTKPTLDRDDFSARNSYLMRALEDYLQERQIREMTGRKDAHEFLQDLNDRHKPTKVTETFESRQLRRFVAQTLEAMYSQVGHLEHYEELLKEWQAVQDERYLSIMASGTITRAHDDLRRAFYKALQEFRKHRQWKLINATIALPPTEL